MDKWPDPNEEAKQTKFASLVGVSQQAISTLVTREILLKGGTYAEWLFAYCDRLRTEAAGRDQDDRLSAARIRETEMNANLKEIEYLKQRGEIIVRDDIQPLLDNFTSAVSFNVMAAKERIIEGIESAHNVTLDDESVSKPLRDALASVASSAEELAGVFTVGAEESDSLGADAD